MNKVIATILLSLVVSSNQTIIATDVTDINDFFAQARPNPTYRTQQQAMSHKEQTDREIIVKNQLAKAGNIQRLFDKEKAEALRTQQERIRREEADEKEACAKRNQEEAKRHQAEKDAAFRAKVTPYIMVEDKVQKGVYVRKEFREFFGEDGTVYDKLPRDRRHFKISFPDGHIYDYDDGYSTWFLEYETPGNTPFMQNEDGTFSYQFNYKGKKLCQTISKAEYPYAIH